MKEDSTKDDVDKKPTGKKSQLKLAPPFKSSDNMEHTPVTAKDSKEPRKTREKKRQIETHLLYKSPSPQNRTRTRKPSYA